MPGWLSWLEWQFQGSTVLDYLLFASFLVGGWLAGLVVNAIVKGRIKKLAQKTATKLDDLVVGILGGPVVLGGFIVGLGVGSGYLSEGGGLRQTAAKGAVALAYLAGAWAIFRAIDGVVQLYVQPWLAKTETKVDDVVVPVAIRGVKVVVAIFALLMALESFGMRVEPLTRFFLDFGLMLVAALAISTIWFLRSIVGGILILFGRQFSEGDRIACGEHTGTVEKIEIHQCILRTADGARIAIPNHDFVIHRISLLQIAPQTKVVDDAPPPEKPADASEPESGSNRDAETKGDEKKDD